MKKLLLAFIALFFIAVSCDNVDETVDRKSIVGVWSPTKMVENIVYNDETTDSETYIYDDCQKQSRYTFNSDMTGNITTYKTFGTTCYEFTNKNFSYTYDNTTGKVVITYLTEVDNGEAMDITDTTMNLKIEEIIVDDSTAPIITKTYESQTYTLVKVQ